MYKFKQGLNPSETLAITANPMVHETWVHDRFTLGQYVSHRTTLPCAFVKYAVLAI